MFEDYDDLSDEEIDDRIYKLIKTVRYAEEHEYEQMAAVAEAALEELKYIQKCRDAKRATVDRKKPKKHNKDE